MIDKYSVDEVLRERWGKRVLLATCAITNRKVVIKEEKKASVATDSVRCRAWGLFPSIAHLIRHESILDIIETIQDPSHLYRIEEYCTGPPLSPPTGLQTPAPSSLITSLLLQFSSLIIHLDQQGLQLSYLDPAQVYWQGDRIKVNVWAKLRWKKGDGLGKAPSGNPAYLAPESVLRGEEATNSVLWSLGVILYWMVYGAQPVQLQSFDSLIKSYSTIKLNRASFSPRRLQLVDLLDRLLVPEHHDRLTLAQLACHLALFKSSLSDQYAIHRDSFLVCPETFHSGYYFLVETAKARLNLAGLESLVHENHDSLYQIKEADQGNAQAFDKQRTKHIMILHLLKLSVELKVMYRSEQIEKWIDGVVRLVGLSFKALNQILMDDTHRGQLKNNYLYLMKNEFEDFQAIFSGTATNSHDPIDQFVIEEYSQSYKAFLSSSLKNLYRYVKSRKISKWLLFSVI
jgi:hypothetical protein